MDSQEVGMYLEGFCRKGCLFQPDRERDKRGSNICLQEGQKAGVHDRGWFDIWV